MAQQTKFYRISQQLTFLLLGGLLLHWIVEPFISQHKEWLLLLMETPQVGGSFY